MIRWWWFHMRRRMSNARFRDRLATDLQSQWASHSHSREIADLHNRNSQFLFPMYHCILELQVYRPANLRMFSY